MVELLFGVNPCCVINSRRTSSERDPDAQHENNSFDSDSADCLILLLLLMVYLGRPCLFFFSFCRASESLLFVVAGECNSDVGSHVLKLCLLKKGMAITATIVEEQ